MSGNSNKVDNAVRDGKVKIIGIIAATSLLIGASFGVQAVADSKVFQHAKLYMTSDSGSASSDNANPFVHKAGWGKHRRGHGHFSKMTDAEIEKRITRVVKHVSIEIDATPEQEQKITALVTALAKDMRPLRNEFRAAAEEMHRLLVADSVDRPALEKLRAERIAEADRVSKELLTTVTDVAEVLTAEQRKILDKRIEQFKSMRGRWHRG